MFPKECSIGRTQYQKTLHLELVSKKFVRILFKFYNNISIKWIASNLPQLGETKIDI